MELGPVLSQVIGYHGLYGAAQMLAHFRKRIWQAQMVLRQARHLHGRDVLVAQRAGWGYWPARRAATFHTQRIFNGRVEPVRNAQLELVPALEDILDVGKGQHDVGDGRFRLRRDMPAPAQIRDRVGHIAQLRYLLKKLGRPLIELVARPGRGHGSFM